MGAEETGLPSSLDAFLEKAEAAEGMRPPTPEQIKELWENPVEEWARLDSELLEALNVMSSELRDLPTSQQEMISYEYRDVDPLQFRDPDEVVFEYSTLFSLVKRELWEHPVSDEGEQARTEGWSDIISLIGYASRADTLDVTLRVPEDAQDVLEYHLEDGEIEQILPTLDALNRITDNLPTTQGERKDPHLRLADAVRSNGAEDVAVAAYNGEYANGLDRVSGADAASPATILDGLHLNEGPWDYHPLNRLDNMPDHIDWTANAYMDEPRSVPRDYQLADPGEHTEIDAIVLDHCIVRDIVQPKTRPSEHEGVRYDGSEVLELINEALNYSVEQEQLPVYILDNQEDNLRPLMDDEHAEYVVEDLNQVAGTVQIDETIDVPEQYMDMEEDYRIVESANEQIDGNPLFVTADNHFSQLDCDALHAGKAVDVIHGKRRQYTA